MTDCASPSAPLVVLDDDPTGTQAVADVPVLLEWDAGLVAEAARSGARALYVLTNSRAYAPERARERVHAAAAAAVDALGRPRLALRGDSTLRTHLLEEYLAVSDAAFGGRTPPLLLVPALPSAGRVTLGGVHFVERDGRRVPLHETEYARDPTFAYSDARLLGWAEERSGGFFAAAAGREVPLEALRSRGPEAVADALRQLVSATAPAVCAPDVENVDDLEVVAAGLRLVERGGAEVLVRSAPTFVGVLARTLARGRVAPPPARGRLLVVCGSYVPNTTRQLAVLVRRHPRSLVEVDARALAGAHAAREVAGAADEVEQRLAATGLAVVATSRDGPGEGWSLDVGERIARNLARVVARTEPQPAAVLAKGGITSAVTATEGLGAARAHVVGPVADGVALWRLAARGGRSIPYVVFPGNVGGEESLADLVDEMIRG